MREIWKNASRAGIRRWRRCLVRDMRAALNIFYLKRQDIFKNMEETD
jgi:hypothetical protein